MKDVKEMNIQEIVSELENNGIHVIMVPMALMPDNLVSLDGIGRASVGNILTDIHTALQMIQNRNALNLDPFI
jgi:hypothetical protein